MKSDAKTAYDAARDVVTTALTRALASDKLVDNLANGILDAFTVRER